MQHVIDHSFSAPTTDDSERQSKSSEPLSFSSSRIYCHTPVYMMENRAHILFSGGHGPPSMGMQSEAKLCLRIHCCINRHTSI